MHLLYVIIDILTPYKPLCRRERLSKYIMQLLCRKKHAWIAAKKPYLSSVSIFK